jgi:hypothetical protein
VAWLFALISGFGMELCIEEMGQIEQVQDSMQPKLKITEQFFLVVGTGSGMTFVTAVKRLLS